MERKYISRKFNVNTNGSCYLKYDFLINNLTSVRNTIKEKYPEVNDKDIEIEIEYDDECWKDTLEYPEPEYYTDKDIRYIQWKDGSHWYAKIGKYDVVDENGNQKWDKYNDAINAAYSFLKKLNQNYFELYGQRNIVGKI